MPLVCGYPHFSDPIAGFSSLPLISFSAGESQKSLSVSVTDSAVYYKGHYSFGDGVWHEFAFDQPMTDGWILGAATKTLPVPRGAGTDNYVIVYTCTKTTTWDCHDQQWQIRQFDTMVEEEQPERIDVIGPHEFWTHENVKDSDDVGYVKYFDMRDFTPRFTEIADSSGGAFNIDQSGLITVSDAQQLSPGVTYTYTVKIEEPGVQESETDVIIHVATKDQTVYFDSGAASSGDGSYEHPINAQDLYDVIGDFKAGKVYLFKRGSNFYYELYVHDPTTSAEKPIVLGAYGKGEKPVFDFMKRYPDDYLITMLNVGCWDCGEVTSYVYAQNLELTGAHIGLENGAWPGHHHLTFLDLYIHDNGKQIEDGGKGMYIWPYDQNQPRDLDIKLINIETARNSDDGAKLGAGGLEIYNMNCHDNGNNGIRLLNPEYKTCLGCVSHGNGHSGIQIRAQHTLLEHFKVWDNGWHGVYVWFRQNPEDPDTYFQREDYLISNGEVWNNYPAGLGTYGNVKQVTFEKVEAHDNQGVGITVDGLRNTGATTQDVTIKDCTIHDNEKQGILTSNMDGTKVSTIGVYIINNTITDNGEAGIEIAYIDGGLVQGNKLSGNGVDDIIVQDTAVGVELRNNTYG